MRVVLSLSILLFSIPALVRAQLNNRVFEDRMSVEETDSGRFFAGVNALGFFRNNEYKKTLVDGYTLFGYQFQPYVSYHLNRHVRIDAGGYFQKDFGNNSFSTQAPIFSVKWRKNEYAIIFGNLESSLNHRLIEPLYDFERMLSNRLETGFQFQINREDFFADLWIDWQYMQYWRDARQEQFVAGLSLKKDIFKTGKGIWSIPLQLTSRHQGGELDTVDLAVQTLVNTAVGLDYRLALDGWVTGININGYYVFDKDITNSRQAYIDGDGWYFNGSISTRWGLDVMASYWQGREFMSFQGGKFYPAVGYYEPTRIQPSPNLVILRFLYDKEVAKNLFLTLRYEPWYDLANSSFQYSYGVYVTYRQRFALSR